MGKTLQEQTDAELVKNKNTVKAILGAMIGVGIVYAGILIYWLVSGNWDSRKIIFIVPWLALWVLAVPLITIHQIHIQEERRRGSSPTDEPTKTD